MSQRILKSLLLILLTICFSNSEDWKYVGIIKMQYKDYHAFYNDSKLRTKDNNLFVISVNLISPEEIETIKNEYPDSLTELVKKKREHYYIPPFLLSVSDTNRVLDRLNEIILYEVLFNTYSARSKYELLIIINVQKKQLKIGGAVVFEMGGARIIKGSEGDAWDSITPNSYGETILKMLVRRLK